MFLPRGGEALEFITGRPKKPQGARQCLRLGHNPSILGLEHKGTRGLRTSRRIGKCIST